MTALKSWTQIATKLKSIPNTYSQKFCALIFLEGFFLMITGLFKIKEYITFLKNH
jgi:MFS superfamily sulfate permease-like transporter